MLLWHHDRMVTLLAVVVRLVEDAIATGDCSAIMPPTCAPLLPEIVLSTMRKVATPSAPRR